MTEPSLEERLRATFERAAAVDVAVAAPVGAVVAGARRRQRRARVARTALVVAVVVALLGALTVERRTRVGNEPDRIERILTNSNTYLPTWLPDDLTLEGVYLAGPLEPTYDTEARTVVVSDVAGNRQYQLSIGRPGSMVPAQVEADRHRPTVSLGDTTASLAPFDRSLFFMSWMLDGRPTSLFAHGVTVKEAVAFASSARLAPDGSVVVDTPERMTLEYSGPRRTAAPNSSLDWRGFGGRQVSLSVQSDATPFSRPWSSEVEQLELPLGPASFVVDSPDQLSVYWLDEAGRQHQLATFGYDRATTIRIAQSLVPADRGGWRRATATVPADQITVLMPGEPGFEPQEASTAPTTAAPPVPFDVGAAGDVGIGGWLDAQVRYEPISNGSIVRLDDGTWIGVDRVAHFRASCQAEPVVEGARLRGWRAPCEDGLTWAPDGRCSSATCGVGLATFPVRIENGRILADPRAWMAGAPGPELTGEAP